MPSFWPATDRRFRVSKPVSFTELVSQIKQFYPAAGVVKYFDDDGDRITMDTETELEEAISLLAPAGMLRLELAHMYDAQSPVSPVPPAAAVPAPAPIPVSVSVAVLTPTKEEPARVPLPDMSFVSVDTESTEVSTTPEVNTPVPEVQAALPPAHALPPPPALVPVALPTSDGLPAGWEVKTDAKGRVYFADHNSRRTSWFHPITKEKATLKPSPAVTSVTPSTSLPDPVVQAAPSPWPLQATQNARCSAAAGTFFPAPVPPTLADMEEMTRRVVTEALAANLRSMEAMVRKVLPEVLAEMDPNNTAVAAHHDDIVIPISMSLAEAQRMQAANGSISLDLPQLLKRRQQQQVQEWVSDPAGPAVHRHIICDGSNANPIVGNRYHRIGEDYDLCEAEFNKLSENAKADFEVICRPGDVPVPHAAPGPATPDREPESFADLITASVVPAAEQTEQTEQTQPGVATETSAAMSTAVEIFDSNDVVVATSPAEEASPPPSAVIVDMPVPVAAVRQHVEFVADLTLPDDTPVPANERLEKKWSVRNSGETVWADGTVLVLAEGLLSGAETTFSVPQAGPGETVEVTAVLHTHGLPADSHVGVYRLKDAAGEAFLGDLLWCKLTVMPAQIPLAVTAEHLAAVRGASGPGSATMSDFGTMDGASDNESEEEFIVVHPETNPDHSEGSGAAVSETAPAVASPTPSPQPDSEPMSPLVDVPSMPDTTSFALDAVANLISTAPPTGGLITISNPDSPVAPVVVPVPAPAVPQSQLSPMPMPPMPLPGLIASAPFPAPAAMAMPLPPVSYAAEMQQLIAMGFANRSVNEESLNRNTGDVEKCINELLSQQDSLRR